jgi:hypothetical protein
MGSFCERKALAPVRCVGLGLLIVCIGLFLSLSAINWFIRDDSLFYQRPSVTVSSLHALRRMISVLVNPAGSLPDSWGPMLAAYDVFLSSTASIYSEIFFKSGVRFQYPPSSLLAIDLLRLMKLEPEMAFPVLNVFFFFILAFTSGLIAVVSFKNLFSLSSIAQVLLFSLGFLMPFVFYPVIHALNMGQVQIWIDAFIALAVLAWLKDRKTVAGGLVAATCVLKPQAGLLLVSSVAARDWSFVRGFLIVGTMIASVSIYRFGWDNHFQYLDVLTFLSRHGESFYANQSLMGLLHRMVGNGPNLVWDAHRFPVFIAWIYWVSSLASLMLFLFLIWVAFHVGHRRDIAGFAFALISVILAAPIVWEHHYGAVLPFFMPLLALALSRQVHFSFYIGLGLSWCLMANYLPALSRFAESSFNFLQSHVFLGGLIFLVLTAQMTLRPIPSEAAKKACQSIKAAPEA